MSGEPRLGGIIDDYCTKCKAVLNHCIVSIVNGEPARTECRTCYTAHKYRRAKEGKKKSDSRKQALFDEVLEKIGPPGAR